jgi:hypothetical protein
MGFPMRLYEVTLLASEREVLGAVARKGAHRSQKKMISAPIAGVNQKK